MKYCIDENSDEPIMLINTHIGIDDVDGMGIDGALFQEELLYLDTLGKKRIQIWINSIGGVVIDGYNICSAILKSKTPVDTYNVGVAVSISGVILMCGRNRVGMDYSLGMVHSPNGGNDAKVLELMQGSLATILSAKCDMTAEQMSNLMTKTTWLNAEEMLECGMITEIESTDSKNKKRMITAANKFDEALKITNKLITIKTKKSMLKVTNKLGLNDDANEDNILNAIKEIENKAGAEKEALQEQIVEVENALKDLKEKYNALEIEVETEKESTMTDKCKNMIEDFAKVGRIANDEVTIGSWINLAKSDFEGTKSLIEGLPLNSKSPVIEVTNTTVLTNPNDMMNVAIKEINNKK